MSYEMMVVGVTTEREVTVVSGRRAFKVNEFLLIEDPDRGNPIGEVVSTQSFNRFMPAPDPNRGFTVDRESLSVLRNTGWDVQDEVVHVARVRLLEDVQSPVTVGSKVRIPAYEEVRRFLSSCSPSEGLVIGVTRGTGELLELPPELGDIAPLYREGLGLLPQEGVPFVFPYRKMDQYPHIGIFGGSGSGKSFGLRVILEELMRHEVPALVFDPHYEMDFSTPLDDAFADAARRFSGRSLLLEAGKDIGVRFEDLNDHDLVNLLDSVGGGLSEAMTNAAITLHLSSDSLTSYRNRVQAAVAVLEGQVAIEKLREVDPLTASQIEAKKAQLGHVSSLRGLSWRLNRLEYEGVFGKDVSRALEGLRQRKTVVVRGKLWFLRVLAGYLGRRCFNQRRKYKDSRQARGAEYFPPFVIVTDEAHNFAPRAFEAPSKTLFREIAQEGRKYGVFLILATQRPALLDDTITAQLNSKLIFRTVRSQDIQVIQEETDLTREETSRLPYLASGCAYFSSAILGRSVAVRVRASKTRSPFTKNPFDELSEESSKELELFFEAIRPELPIKVGLMVQKLESISRRLDRKVEVDDVVNMLGELERAGLVRSKRVPVVGPEYFIPDGQS